MKDSTNIIDIFDEIYSKQENAFVIPLKGKLQRHLFLRKQNYFVIFGPPGCGKSSFLNSEIILNSAEYVLENNCSSNLKIILFFMERSKRFLVSRWISRRVFLSEGVVITPSKIFGWESLTLSERDLIKKQREYFKEISELIEVIAGPQNPTGIYKKVKEYALSTGEFHNVNEFEKVYIPHNDKKIVVVAIDHMLLVKREKGVNSRKEAVEVMSEYNRYFRDVLGYTPIAVLQPNRNISNPILLRMDSVEPTLDDIKESGSPGEDSDCVISLFDPLRYRTNDPYYDAEKFIDPTGAKHFRKLKILKNSYGEDLISYPMAYMGITGIFRSLPKPNEMVNFDYEKIFNYSYYLT